MFVWINSCQGMGVSSPFVKNAHLLPGSHLEETVYIVRSEVDQEYRVKVEFSSEALKIEDWITIDKGMEFTIPAGVQKFPLKIIVDVPKNAELGEYKGYIWISGKPKEKEGQITTVVGGTIELALKVTDKEFSDWRLWDLKVRDLRKGEETLKVYLTVENLGNVKTRLSRVHLDVYDNYYREILESGEESNLEYIEPFQTKEIVAEFPVNLEPNQQYWAEIEVYKGDKIFLTEKRRFNVGEIEEKKETAPSVEPKPHLGFSFLKSKPFLFALLGVVLVIGLVFGIRRLRKFRLKKRRGKYQE